MSEHEHDDRHFDQVRRAVCDWLTANGVSPNRTPRDPRASITDGRLTLLQKVQRNGRDVLAPGGAEVMTETITVPVVVEPTGLVATWLAPRCLTCGR